MRGHRREGESRQLRMFLQPTRHTQVMVRARLDRAAVAASVLALAMLIVYLSVIRQQEGQPAAWAVSALIIGAGAAAYGAVVTAPTGVRLSYLPASCLWCREYWRSSPLGCRFWSPALSASLPH